MAYTPSNVPADPARLPDFLRAELKRLSEVLGLSTDILRLASVNVAPDKPRTGDVRLADGTNWNPASEGFGFVWWDGDSWEPLDSPSALSYDVGCFIQGKPTASEKVMRFVTPRAFDLPASFTGSKGDAATAATAQTDFDVKKGATSIGTIRFSASAVTASFIAASATAFTAGDVLSVVAPATPDATLADISITFKGSRS